MSFFGQIRAVFGGARKAEISVENCPDFRGGGGRNSRAEKGTIREAFFGGLKGTFREFGRG